MSSLRTFHLDLLDGDPPADQEDALCIFQTVAQHGLVPGLGPISETQAPPLLDVDALPAFVPTVYHDYHDRKPRGRYLPVESWGGIQIVPTDGRRAAGSLAVSRLGNGRGYILLSFDPFFHDLAGLTLAEFAEAYGGILERIGSALVPKVRPGLAMLTTQRLSESGDFTRDVDRRQLVVGWRTWYGPAYVERYGRDFLLGLPDRAEELPDGGIYHRLDASALTMLERPAEANARLWPYLAQHDITPVWPRPPRRRSS